MALRIQPKHVAVIVLLGLANGGAISAAEKEEGQFVRLQRDEQKQPKALETAIVRFKSAEPRHAGLIVDLVGAIHVADKSYYDQLNRRFRRYGAVLYELVAREGANVPQPGQGGGGVVGGVQVGMKSLLDLEFQLDCIDYGQENMVHADMSPEEFAETMKRRNESFAGMFFRLFGRALAEQAEDPLGRSDWELMAAMFAPDRPYRLKLIMAKEFAELEGQTDILDGPDGSTIITERNGKALEVLDREIKGGRKRIAIFYGAGHLADLQRRLEKDFQMKRVKTEWLTAWSLEKKKATE